MLKVGLTGGIGAGKSTVATRLARHGAVLVDADVIARQVVAPGSEGLAAVTAEFGTGVLDTTGGLNRTRLAEIVFADPGARTRLESIVHPLVRARTAELMAAAPADAVVLNDVPLLVETGLAATYHLVVVVEADPRVRRARLVGRGMTVEAAEARIATQASDDERRVAADVLIDNSGDRDALHAAVDELWSGRLVGYERRLRLREPVRRGEDLRLVETNGAWQARYRRIAARIRCALGGRFDRLDHVGSTAVPGLVAKDVLDIQVVVPDLDAADRLAGSLAGAGFPRFAGEWYDDPPPTGAPDEVLAKRFHGGADPGLLVQVHVRPARSPAWRYALMFRDWLRADATVRGEYAALKQRLAGRGLSTSEYAEAKGPWFATALPRLDRWAISVGWRPS